MNNLKIGTKLLLLMVVSSLFMALLGAYGINRLSAMHKWMEYERDRAGQVMRARAAAGAVQTTFRIQVQEWKDILIRGNDARLYEKHSTAFAARSEEVKNSLRDLRDTLLALGLDASEADRLAAALDQLNGQYAAALKHFDPANPEAGKVVDALVAGADRAPTQAIMDLVRKISEISAEFDKAARDGVLSQYADARLTMLAAIGVTIALSCALAFLLIKAITRPLGLTVTYAEAVRQGNLGASLDVRGADEVGQLADVLRQMVASLKEKIGLAEGVLKGMTVPYLLVDTGERTLYTNQECLDMVELDGKPQDYLGRTLADIFYNDPSRQTVVGKAMKTGETFRNKQVEIAGHKGGKRQVHYNVFPLHDLDGTCIGGFCLYVDVTELKAKEQRIEEQNRTISEVAAHADGIAVQVASASEELSAQVGESSRGAEEQKAMAGEAATAMEQMNASVLEVARHAQGAAAGAEHAKNKAQGGASVVDEAVGAIFSVREQTQAMKDSLGELGLKVDDIGRIMDVISDIADQTNLLALNAAIEAARAGDAGRGFAVVADEVRKLAEKTMAATKEVGTAISAIQAGTQTSLGAMDGAVHAVEKSTGLAEKAGTSLREIVTLVENTADQVRSIATASEEQSAASEQVNKSIARISGISAKAADAMSQSAEAIADLAKLSTELKAVIESMRN